VHVQRADEDRLPADGAERLLDVHGGEIGVWKAKSN
jgi:hypothetical protein